MKKEAQWIEQIRTWVGATCAEVRVGIGDDAAVLAPAVENAVVTQDSLIESVHFDLSYATPEEVGHKALAVNLSDIAAMAAEPLHALVSLALPPEKAEAFLPGFYTGLGKLAARFGVSVVGGNLARSPGPIFIDITLLGQTKHPALRSGAQVGDAIFLVGGVGLAAAGLELLQKQGRKVLKSPWSALAQAQLCPEPQVLAGKQMPGVHALIDVSDGLASELGHLAKASGVQLQVEGTQLPISDLLKTAQEDLSRPLMAYVLQGGEDYALLGTAPESALAQWKFPFRRIGKVAAGSGVQFLTPSGVQELPTEGFDHFS